MKHFFIFGGGSYGSVFMCGCSEKRPSIFCSGFLPYRFQVLFWSAHVPDFVAKCCKRSRFLSNFVNRLTSSPDKGHPL
jgi:hypothetical protein